MLFGDTVAAIATPPGAGGLAVIRLSGPDTYEIIDKIFRPKNTGKIPDKMPGYSAAFGEIYARDQLVDTVVALFFRAPHSYSGEDVVELSCHGGTLVSRAVLDACLQAGAKPAGPGEFTKRAVLNGKLGLPQAEAVLGLIEATGEQSLRQANRALQGDLAQKIEGVRQSLIRLAGHLAAFVDYPEEDVEALTPDAFLQTLQEALLVLEELKQSYKRGSVVQRGVQTAIVGSPNVGKSTLFNLLSGFDRSIVTSVAGTTRDVVREQVQIGGIALHVADTAGLHDSKDIVETEGIKRSYEELENAGLVLAVFDGSTATSAADMELAKRCAGRPSLAIINKNDLEPNFSSKSIAPFFTEVIHLSAMDPGSIKILEKAVLRVLQLDLFDPDAAAITTDRQYFTINRSIKALREAENVLSTGLTLDAAGVCLDDALADLGELLGEDVSQDVINDVFSRFCVGK